MPHVVREDSWRDFIHITGEEKMSVLIDTINNTNTTQRPPLPHDTSRVQRVTTACAREASKVA